MAKERLSRLQKWILKTLYIISPDAEISMRDLKITAINGLGIWGKSETLDLPWKKEQVNHRCIEASLSRTLRNLENKDLILTSPADRFLKNPGWLYVLVNTKSVCLTKEGQAKARELLNVKKSELNNKE